MGQALHLDTDSFTCRCSLLSELRSTKQMLLSSLRSVDTIDKEVDTQNENIDKLELLLICPDLPYFVLICPGLP